MLNFVSPFLTIHFVATVYASFASLTTPLAEVTQRSQSQVLTTKSTLNNIHRTVTFDTGSDAIISEDAPMLKTPSVSDLPSILSDAKETIVNTQDATGITVDYVPTSSELLDKKKDSTKDADDFKRSDSCDETFSKRIGTFVSSTLSRIYSGKAVNQNQEFKNLNTNEMPSDVKTPFTTENISSHGLQPRHLRKMKRPRQNMLAANSQEESDFTLISKEVSEDEDSEISTVSSKELSGSSPLEIADPAEIEDIHEDRGNEQNSSIRGLTKSLNSLALDRIIEGLYPTKSELYIDLFAVAALVFYNHFDLRSQIYLDL